MNILGMIGSVGKFLLGGGSGGGSSVVETVAKAADEYKYTSQEQAEDEAKSIASARVYEPSHMPAIQPIMQTGLVFFVLEWLLRLLNLLVDAMIHLIRPWITVELFGGLFGYWKLPDVSGINPLYISLIDVVVVFWFGARVITKDLPALMVAWYKMREMVKK